MIKVKDVKYGIMPYSAGIGQSAIGIYFEDDDRTFDFEGLDEAKDEAVFRDAYTNIAQEMYKDIKDFVAKNNITEQWNAGLSFEKGIYTAPAIYAQCDLKNISLGLEKASQLLDNYLVNTREVLSNLDKNVYSKALLEILDLLKL